jgi:hypothetical protein
MEPLAEIVPAAERVRRSLESSKVWAAALSGGTVRSPALKVMPLSRRITSYYLVEIIRGPAVTARFALAHDGALLEAEGVSESGARLSAWIAAPKNALNEDAPLVWKPCEQSTTRLRPFFQVQRSAGAAFVRVDGAAYTDLTVPIGRG